MSYIGQLDRNGMNVAMHSAAADALVLNDGLTKGQEQHINSTLHLLLMITITVEPKDIVGNAGRGDGLEPCSRLVLYFDPPALVTLHIQGDMLRH